MTDADAPPDADLASRAVNGDASAFAIIVARYKTPLFRFILRYVRHDDDAYDLLQQVYVSAWLSLSQYDTNRPLRTWLQTIALNKCRDHVRKIKVRRMLFGIWSGDDAANVADQRESAEDGLLRDEKLRALNIAITELPRQLKEPLLLTLFGGFSQADAGRQLGISAKAVETRIARARRALVERLVEKTERGEDNVDA